MHGVTYQIWCQAQLAAQALRAVENAHSIVVCEPPGSAATIAEDCCNWASDGVQLLYQRTISANGWRRNRESNESLGDSGVSGISSRGNPGKPNFADSTRVFQNPHWLS